MINLLTIDVEDWFHTSALDPYIGVSRWDGCDSRVAANVRVLLKLLDEHQIRATFFVLGWVAERHPELVQEIAQGGHEIGSHGYQHRLIYDLTQSQFKEYVGRSKKILEDLTGQAVWGYRATSFSLVEKTLWALDLIKEAGFIYDSSMFPIRHDIYGIEGMPRFPFVHANGLLEIPPSTLCLGGRNIPIAGGGYFRLYPYLFTQHGIRSLNRQGYPAMVYLHPWEIDPLCPRVKEADWRTRFRQYVNLGKTKNRLRKLLRDFHFSPVKEQLKMLLN